MRHIIMFVCINAIGALLVLMSVVFQGVMLGYPSVVLLVIGGFLNGLSLPIVLSSWFITKWNADIVKREKKAGIVF